MASTHSTVPTSPPAVALPPSAARASGVVPIALPSHFNSLEQVSDSLMARYGELVYAKTGVRVLPQKKALLSNRLRRRLRSTGIEGFEEYYRHLKRLPSQDPEWDAFLQEITTHETYLFRDRTQWDWFCRTYLPGCAAAPHSHQGSLRIWSAACSTGDEAFTTACCVAAFLPNLDRWKVRILGTDIGKGAVEQARTGAFGERAMRLVPDSHRRCYFTKAKNVDLWQAKPILTDMVAFRQHNLLDPLHERPFDLVFLKNVLIYFDRDSKKRVLANVQAAIRPGGFLVAGTAEGVTELLGGFERVQSWLLRKPLS
jgi:chemotaxis protein methyltransferase CheR